MCLQPITLTRKIANHYYLNNVPCNKCLECVKDRQNEYIIRSIEEQRKRGSMVFFTLTYSPETLPMNEYEIVDEQSGELNVSEVASLRRSDVSLWMKSFKQFYKREGVELDFSYMITGEYGPRTHRPHYHGLIFGLSDDYVNDLMWRWKTKFGFVCFKRIPSLMADVEKVARYCAKYMIKDENWKEFPAGAEKPRIMTTQFYGLPSKERWTKMIDYYLAKDVADYDPNKPVFATKADMYKVVESIINRRKYKIGNGREYRLPNYYKRKIFYTKVAGKDRASEIQRMVSYNVQCMFDKNYEEELQSLASLYNARDYAQAVDIYNRVHESCLMDRALRYAQSNDRYMLKSIC